MTGFDAVAAERALVAANFALLVPFHRCLVSWGPTAAVEAPPPAAADAQSALSASTSSIASEVISLFDADAVRVVDWWPTAQFGTVLALSVAPSSLASPNILVASAASSSSLAGFGKEASISPASLSNPSSFSSLSSSFLYLLHETSPGAAPDVSCLRTATAAEFVTHHLPALCRAAISASAASTEAALASESIPSIETGDSSSDSSGNENVALALRELMALHLPSSSLSSSSSNAVAMCVCGAVAVPNSVTASPSSAATVTTTASGLATVATVGVAAPFACVRRVGMRALLHAAADAEAIHLQPIDSGDQSLDGNDDGIDSEYQDSEQSSADGMLSLLLLALSSLAPFAIFSAVAPSVAAAAGSARNSAARILSALLDRVDAAEKRARIQNSSESETTTDRAGADSVAVDVADSASQLASAASSLTFAPSAAAPSPWSDAPALFVRVLRQWHAQYMYRRQQWRRQQRQQQQQKLEVQAQKLQASSSARAATDSADNQNVTLKSASSAYASTLSVALSSAEVLSPPNQSIVSVLSLSASALPLFTAPVLSPLSAIAENATDSPPNMAQIDASATFPTPVVWHQMWHFFESEIALSSKVL